MDDVAVVFGETETRLYLDGRKVGVGPATKPVGGAEFVVGNVGKDNPINFFVARPVPLCISKGERYRNNFLPDEAFAKDAEDAPLKAILIYDGAAVERLRVLGQERGRKDSVRCTH